MTLSASTGVLLDYTQDKIVVVDQRGRVTFANDALERMAGWDPASFREEDIFEYVHPDDVEETRAAFERTISSEAFTETTTRYRFRTRDGEWLWLESRMSNLTDDELDGYVVSSRDVTDRIEAQRANQESTSRLRELSATTGDVLWMFDGDWSELLFVNPAYEEVYGQPIDELEDDPRTFLDAIHPDDIRMVRDAMERLSAGESVDMEYRTHPASGYRVWVWVQAEPIVEDGEVVRITGFTRDITERYRRERQLYVLDNLLRHNLRNDLNIISGQARLIEEEAPETAELTAVIRRTSEDLLASAEKERRIIELLTDEPDRCDIDLTDALADAVEQVRERYPTADVEVSAPAGAPGYALEEIRLVIVELLENSVVHGENELAPVSVTVSLDPEQVRLVVEDGGPPIPGMEAAVLKGEHEMSNVYHSSGLGLWLVYWIVELSGGEIDVTRRDRTNRIELTLPRPRTREA